MIPKTDATDPWQLKRYLNCARLAGERMKQDKTQQFEEHRFIVSVMTKLCGPSYDYLLKHNTSRYKELEGNLVKFFIRYSQDRVAKQKVTIPDVTVPPVNELMQFFENLQEIKNDFTNMGDFCRDRTLIDEILIKKALLEFNDHPYKLERRVSQSHFKIFKDDCMEQVVKWFSEKHNEAHYGDDEDSTDSD